ncbi:DASH complex subunit Ask1 domain containing protein [Elaphomyces granulatus]|jgi:DASH complex subunit ASK1
MSRAPAPAAPRNLTLTEELEKLEQSITLTLQEIDSNFSRAHRIVTTSILPLVEQYAEHSKEVWDGAKFWKQFFEASANVSLSGYEDQPKDDTEHEQTLMEESTNTTHTSLDEAVSYETPSSEHLDLDRRDEDLDLSSLSLSPSHSTPRPHSHRTQRPDEELTSSASIAYPSPQESLGRGGGVEEDETVSTFHDTAPRTPGKAFAGRGRLSDTPLSSPFVPPSSNIRLSTARKANANQKPRDPVLHRVLDKTYRIQATPLGKGYGRSNNKFNVVTPKSKSSGRYGYVFNDSPISSPEMEAPKLHDEIFASPIKKSKTGGAGAPGTAGRKRRTSTSSKSQSRVTPKSGILRGLTPRQTLTLAKKTIWDSDDDDDLDDLDNTGDMGASPPKTMQFHIPQSRLMKTPAREASKRIVSDLLTTAGGGEDITDYDDEHSPTVVRRALDFSDVTF